MPSWLIQLLVGLAIKVGIPYLVKLLPGIPPEVIQVIEELIKQLQGANQTKQAAKQDAHQRIRKVITGQAPDLVKE